MPKADRFWRALFLLLIASLIVYFFFKALDVRHRQDVASVADARAIDAGSGDAGVDAGPPRLFTLTCPQMVPDVEHCGAVPLPDGGLANFVECGLKREMKRAGYVTLDGRCFAEEDGGEFQVRSDWCHYFAEILLVPGGSARCPDLDPKAFVDK